MVAVVPCGRQLQNARRFALAIGPGRPLGGPTARLVTNGPSPGAIRPPPPPDAPRTCRRSARARPRPPGGWWPCSSRRSPAARPAPEGRGPPPSGRPGAAATVWSRTGPSLHGCPVAARGTDAVAPPCRPRGATATSRTMRERPLRDRGGHPGLHPPQRGVEAARSPPARRGCPTRSTTPSSSTWMRSASRTVDSRWAMTSVVRSRADVLERALDRGLGLVVDGRGGLVEHQDRRVAQDRPGDRQPLALPARELLAPLADDRVVALGERRDEVVRLGEAGGLLDRLGRRASGRRRRCSRARVPSNRNTSWLTQPIAPRSDR